MEKLFPNAHDFDPIIKQASEIAKSFSDSIKLINSALYMEGVMTGIVLTATVLTAIWAFSRGR